MTEETAKSALIKKIVFAHIEALEAK